MKLDKGDVIIFPTDTVYGIGASAYDVIGQEKIYNIKKRPETKRLSILCASLEDIEKIAIVDDRAKKIINAFMPGALTVILKTKPEVISESIHDTVGVRIPNHPLALRLLKENGPMATTSVNISGEPPMNDYFEIVKKFSSDVLFIYPNAEVPSRVSSTVVDLTGDAIKVLREGEITLNDIKKCINE